MFFLPAFSAYLIVDKEPFDAAPSGMNATTKSVKILEGLYNRFKLVTVNTKMTLQKLTNRSMDMYLNNEDFRDKVETNQHLVESGSNF